MGPANMCIHYCWFGEAYRLDEVIKLAWGKSTQQSTPTSRKAGAQPTACQDATDIITDAALFTGIDKQGLKKWA